MSKTVLCFGTFDGLHAGHDDYFRQAREYGDRLIVVVACDHMVLDINGDLPETNQDERLGRVRDHALVDEAVLSYPGDKYRIIEEMDPDIICLGYDQEAFADNLDIELTRRGLASSVVRCQPYFPDTFKSALLRGARITEDGFQEEESEEEGIPL
jgi:FAD synthetase